jgi:hypothetical protein
MSTRAVTSTARVLTCIKPGVKNSGRLWRGGLVRGFGRGPLSGLPLMGAVFPGSAGRVKGRVERGRVSDAVGAALEAGRWCPDDRAARGWPVRPGNVNERRWVLSPSSFMWSRAVVASVSVGVCGAGGSQTYLWPSGGLCVPGDRMMDWLTPPPAEGAAAQSH